MVIGWKDNNNFVIEESLEKIFESGNLDGDTEQPEKAPGNNRLIRGIRTMIGKTHGEHSL